MVGRVRKEPMEGLLERKALEIKPRIKMIARHKAKTQGNMAYKMLVLLMARCLISNVLCGGYGMYNTTSISEILCDEGATNPYSKYIYKKDIILQGLGSDGEGQIRGILEKHYSPSKSTFEVDDEDPEIYRILSKIKVPDHFIIVPPFILLGYDNQEALDANDDSFFVPKTLITPLATASDWSEEDLKWKEVVIFEIGFMIRINVRRRIFTYDKSDNMNILLDEKEMCRLLRRKFKNENIDWERIKNALIGAIQEEVSIAMVKSIKEHWDSYTRPRSRMAYMELIYNIHMDIIKQVLPGFPNAVRRKGGNMAQWVAKKLVNVIKYEMTVQLFSIMVYTELFKPIEGRSSEATGLGSRESNIDIIVELICTRKFGRIALMDEGTRKHIIDKGNWEGGFESIIALYQIFLSDSIRSKQLVGDLISEIRKAGVSRKKGKGSKETGIRKEDIYSKYFTKSKRFGEFDIVIDWLVLQLWKLQRLLKKLSSEGKEWFERFKQLKAERQIKELKLGPYEELMKKPDIDTVYEKALNDIRFPPSSDQESAKKAGGRSARKKKEGGKKKGRRVREETEVEEEENVEQVPTVREAEKIIVSPRQAVSVCNLLWVTERVANWLCSPKELLGYFEELYAKAVFKEHGHARKYWDYSNQPISSVEYQRSLHNHQAVMDVFSKVEEWESYFYGTSFGYNAHGTLINSKGEECVGTLQIGICIPSSTDQIALEFKKRAVKEYLKRGIISQKEYESISQSPFGKDSVVYHLYFQPGLSSTSDVIHFNQYTTNWSSKINAERSLEEEIKEGSSPSTENISPHGALLLYEIYILKDEDDYLDTIRIEYFNQKDEKISTLILRKIPKVLQQ